MNELVDTQDVLGLHASMCRSTGCASASAAAAPPVADASTMAAHKPAANGVDAACQKKCNTPHALVEIEAEWVALTGLARLTRPASGTADDWVG